MKSLRYKNIVFFTCFFLMQISFSNLAIAANPPKNVADKNKTKKQGKPKTKPPEKTQPKQQLDEEKETIDQMREKEFQKLKEEKGKASKVVIEDIKPKNKSTISFELGFREAFSVYNPSEPGISFKNYSPGVNLGLGYFFNNNIGLHAEGNFFMGNGFNSFFVPLTLRFKPITNNSFDLYTGVGAFISYANGKIPFGALGEIGGQIKIYNNFALNLGLDFGLTFIPGLSGTFALKSGVVYLL